MAPALILIRHNTNRTRLIVACKRSDVTKVTGECVWWQIHGISHHFLTPVTDDRLYQMNHCVSIPKIFVSAIFASLSRQMTRATLPSKMALTAKMRDCSRFMALLLHVIMNFCDYCFLLNFGIS
jgi:hypothetical protein